MSHSSTLKPTLIFPILNILKPSLLQIMGYFLLRKLYWSVTWDSVVWKPALLRKIHQTEKIAWIIQSLQGSLWSRGIQCTKVIHGHIFTVIIDIPDVLRSWSY